MSEFDYKAPPPKVRLTQEGKERLAKARHRELILRIQSRTGEPPSSIEAKLLAGESHCKKHGWRKVSRCELCHAEYKRARKLTTSELVQKLRNHKPELAGMLRTGREVEDVRQLCFRYPTGRANR